MQTTYEQVIEAARQLSPEEIEKLGEWARQQQSAAQEANGKDAAVEEEIRKYKLATRWIGEHRKEYLGQWVCLDGDVLISHGGDAVKVHAQAKAKGIKAPFLEHIVEEPEAYLGGWEACR